MAVDYLYTWITAIETLGGVNKSASGRLRQDTSG